MERYVDQLKLVIKRYVGPCLKAVNSETLKILGYIDVNLLMSINGESRTSLIQALVVEIFALDVLLENDFNSKMGLMVDCENKSIVSKSQTSALKAENVCPVYLAKTVVIPPRISSMVNIKLSDCSNNHVTNICVIWSDPSM